MAGFLAYFDKHNQRSTEFENERHRRRLGSTAADIGLVAGVTLLLRWLVQGLTDATLEAVLGAIVTLGWLAIGLFVAVRAWVRTDATSEPGSPTTRSNPDARDHQPGEPRRGRGVGCSRNSSRAPGSHSP